MSFGLQRTPVSASTHKPTTCRPTPAVPSQTSKQLNVVCYRVLLTYMDVLIPAIWFADDQAMVSHTMRGLQVIMDALQDISEKYNMKINTKKTKIMRMSTVEGRTMKITVNEQNLERVKQFCYLRSLVTEDCRSCHDARRRIALGKEAFNKKSDLMRGSLSLHLKKRMVKAFVEPSAVQYLLICFVLSPWYFHHSPPHPYFKCLKSPNIFFV